MGTSQKLGGITEKNGSVRSEEKRPTKPKNRSKTIEKKTKF